MFLGTDYMNEMCCADVSNVVYALNTI
jgi:hypothetical protein